ncbi:zf-HC2 domain-containing protein [Acidisoma cellulosilytica]|uniref:Zf-HC2 domain-containing protein n=1 Tax=Acidisoma cellulosilyticum TaxID=2802395 RepID=A0A963Z6F1_9PROT|nr:zf-HC2 domain-containing protein [Acidisoma cellulosilyticum]MCB8882698.1 zf-HC2 domain-containing protein [Acidisoma cellulosilyticum]
MSCDDRHEHLNALLDGELSAPDAAVLTAHLAVCPACMQRLGELAAIRAAIAGLHREIVSPALEQRILAMTDDAMPKAVLPFRPRRRQIGMLAIAAGIAALLVVTLSPGKDHLADFVAVRDAAQRSALMQTMAPAGAINPPVVPGFTLAASRTDILVGHKALVATYRRDGSVITLCAWPAGKEPAHGLEQKTYRGAAITYWNDGKNEYWVTSAGPRTLVSDFVTGLSALSGA